MGDHIEGCAKFKGDHIAWSSLIQRSSNFITEGSQVGQACFTLGESVLINPLSDLSISPFESICIK